MVHLLLWKTSLRMLAVEKEVEWDSEIENEGERRDCADEDSSQAVWASQLYEPPIPVIDYGCWMKGRILQWDDMNGDENVGMMRWRTGRCDKTWCKWLPGFGNTDHRPSFLPPISIRSFLPSSLISRYFLVYGAAFSSEVCTPLLSLHAHINNTILWSLCYQPGSFTPFPSCWHSIIERPGSLQDDWIIFCDLLYSGRQLASLRCTNDILYCSNGDHTASGSCFILLNEVLLQIVPLFLRSQSFASNLHNSCTPPNHQKSRLISIPVPSP